MCCSKVLIIAVCLLALGVSTAFSAIVLIDNFEDGETDLTVELWGLPSTGDMQTGLSGVVGGKRQSLLSVDSGPDSVTMRVNYLHSGVFGLSSGYNTRGTGRLSYWDWDNDLNLDLTGGGANSHLVVTFVTADLAGTLDIMLSTDAGGRSNWSGPTPGGIFHTPTKMMIPLFGAGWSDSGGPADRTDVDTLNIIVHSVENGDYAIEDIYTDVPEPASLALLSIGALAILKRRRKA